MFSENSPDLRIAQEVINIHRMYTVSQCVLVDLACYEAFIQYNLGNNEAARLHLKNLIKNNPKTFELYFQGDDSSSEENTLDAIKECLENYYPDWPELIEILK